KLLRDVGGLSLSRGQLAKVSAKVSAALAGPYDELLAALPGQASLNVDETGHKDQGQSMWTWCFRAELYTLFKIDPRRSAEVLIEVLGREFDGVLGCDHFSAYRRYMRTCGVTVQFCLAHLIREVKFLTTLPELADVLYGTRLLMALEGLFGVIHRREQVPEGEFARQLQEARRRGLAAGTRDEGTPNSRRMAKRMARYGEAYFTFVTTPGVEPTNNLAEQAIRFVVIDRLVTQGTRSETGQRWSERIWTVLASCAQQGRSAFAYLEEAGGGHFARRGTPALLAPGGGVDGGRKGGVQGPRGRETPPWRPTRNGGRGAVPSRAGRHRPVRPLTGPHYPGSGPSTPTSKPCEETRATWHCPARAIRL